jgi:hypothetical protein
MSESDMRETRETPDIAEPVIGPRFARIRANSPLRLDSVMA